MAWLPIVGRLVPAFLDLGWPYTRSSGVVRTRVIDDIVRDAIRAGAQQLVLLGAGFDSRAYRLEEAKVIASFEVDHPATQDAKQKRLSAAPGKTPGNVHFVKADFEKDNLEQLLEGASFEKKAPAVVVWEGVAMRKDDPDASTFWIQRCDVSQKRDFTGPRWKTSSANRIKPRSDLLLFSWEK